MTDTNVELARNRIRTAAHNALRAKRRRRATARAVSFAMAVALVGAIGWWTVQRPALPDQTDGVVANGGGAAHSEITLQIVSFTPAPIEHISDEDLARALRDAGSPYGLVISKGGVRAVANSQGL